MGFTIHKHLDLCADDEDPSQLVIRPGWDVPHVRCLPRTFCAWPCLLRQVGTVLGSPCDCIMTGITYANPGSRHVCRHQAISGAVAGEVRFEGISLDSAIKSFRFLFLFSLVRLMENNNKMRELYELYLELGHEVFEVKIKKPMELYLHTLHDCNVTSMSSLNTFDANDMQSYKLGDAMFDEDDLFSPPSFDEEIYFDDTLPPIYDDYCDDTYSL